MPADHSSLPVGDCRNIHYIFRHFILKKYSKRK